MEEECLFHELLVGGYDTSYNLFQKEITKKREHRFNKIKLDLTKRNNMLELLLADVCFSSFLWKNKNHL